jgi:hypothetical protein
MSSSGASVPSPPNMPASRSATASVWKSFDAWLVTRNAGTDPVGTTLSQAMSSARSTSSANVVARNPPRGTSTRVADRSHTLAA